MRLIAAFASLILCAAAAAQRPHFELNAETPEGQMLQVAAQTEDEAQRVQLYEAYLAKYPQHEGVWWAWAQLQPLYLKAGQFDKVIQAAEAVLAIDQANSAIAYNALQAAEKKNSIDDIKIWSARTVEAARKMIESKKPEDEDELEHWKSEVDYATQVITRCEYSLYAAALAATDPKFTVDLAATLEERHPESQYIPQLAGRHFLALQQTGDRQKAAVVAERSLEKDKTNPEMMLVVADHYMQGRKDLNKALEYAKLLVTTVEPLGTPEGMAAEDWDKRKKVLIGLGHWMQGMVLSEQKKWADSDKAFRASLPFIAGNNDLLGPAYFFLGLANYNMSRGNPKLRAEALRWNELCSKIKGPYQNQAIRNINAINAGR